MADLEANLMHLQLMHESLSRFGESFAAFLYGLNMNAFVVDFPEVRVGRSFQLSDRFLGPLSISTRTTIGTGEKDVRCTDTYSNYRLQ
jgi:DASH complex subunit DAM1